MPIYHLHLRRGQRNSGTAALRSAGAKADYILRQGRYRAGEGEIECTASGHMPGFAGVDPRQYWKAADEYERANASLFVELQLALPRELDGPARQRLAEGFAARVCDGERLPWSLAIHRGGGTNPHAHLMISERANDGIERDPTTWFRRAASRGRDPALGGARKTTTLQPKDWLLATRAAWAEAANTALAEAGEAARIDHRTLEAQRLEAEAAGDHAAAEKLDRLPVHQSRASIALESEDPDERPGTMPRRRRRRRRPVATAPGRRARQTRRGNDQHRQALDETRHQAQRIAAKAAALKAQARNLEAELEAARIAAAEAALKAQQQKEDEEYRAWLARLPQKLARLRDAGRYRGPDAPEELHIVSHPVFVAQVARAQGEAAGVIDRAAMDDDEAPHLVGRWMRWLGRVTEPVFTPPGEREERVLLRALEDRRAAGLEVARAERESLVLVPTNRQAEALSLLGEAQGQVVLTFGQVEQDPDLQRLVRQVDALPLPWNEADRPRKLQEAITDREREAPAVRKRAAAMRSAVENDRIAAAAAGWRGRGHTALHWAAAGGDASAINRLIQAGADVNARDRLHTTPLHLAASLSARPDVITLLVEAGADVNARDRDDDRTPLHWAAQNANPAPIVRRLIEAGADPRARDKWGMTPLHTHSHQTFVAKAARFVGEVFDAHADTHPSITPVRHSDPEAIKALIRAGADPDAIDDHGNTPLHMAAGWWGKTAQARALLEVGANVNAVNDSGSTPLHQAALRKNAGMVAMLIEAAAELFARDEYGKTPLEVARQKKGNEEVIEYLETEEAAWDLAPPADPDPGGETDAKDGGQAAAAKAPKREPARQSRIAGNDKTPTEVGTAAGPAPAGRPDPNARDEDSMTPLHHAAMNDDADEISRLIEAGADVNARDEWSITPLHYAARRGNPEIAARALIEAGANVDAVSRRGNSPLHWAAWWNTNPEMAARLIKADANLEARNKLGETPLHVAAQAAKPAVITLLIETGADLEARNKDGHTPLVLARQRGDDEVTSALAAAELHHAARRGNTARIAELVGGGTDVNTRNKLGETPLHVALEADRPEVVSRLIEFGADVNARDEHGHSPLHYAAILGNTARIAELGARGADPNIGDNEGRTPLHIAAARRGAEQAVTTLIELGADPSIRNKDAATALEEALDAGNAKVIETLLEACGNERRTPLHLAVLRSDLATITKLLELGASVHARDWQRRTPLHLAATAEVAACLLARKADRNTKDREDRTPLHLAALHGNAEVAACLLAGKRLRMNARDRYGCTPQYYAARRGDVAMVDLLTNRQQSGGRLPPGSHALARLAKAVAAGDVNFRDGHGETSPHQVPAAPPTPEIVTVQGETQTPLRHAVGNDKTPAVAGTVAGQDPAGLPDPNARNEDGWTTLHEAAMNDNPDEITRLIAAGAEVNAANHDGKTPLHLAARRDNPTVITRLLEGGAELQAQDNEGRTPLEVARVQSYSPEVIEALEAATNLPAASPLPPARPVEIVAPATEPDSPSTPSM